MLNIKKTLIKILAALTKDINVVTFVQSTATSVSANGGTAWTQVRISSSYTPICVVGYYLDGGGGCSVYNMSLGHDSNGYYGSFAMRNGSTTTASVKITAHVLCRVGGVINNLKKAISNLYREGVAVC